MRSRTFFSLAFFLTVGYLALPYVVHAAAIPFFGPIIPDAQIIVNGIATNQNVCPAGWGMVLVVINNIITFAITIAIVFVAPLMIGYAGFLMVVNPTSAGNVQKARTVLTNTIIGIVISLAGWMIVGAIMAVLYNPTKANGLKAWSNIIGSHGAPACLPQAGALPGEGLAQVQPSLVPGAPGGFTFDPEIDAQVATESGALQSLLSCMVTKVPAGVGRISSISDRAITSGSKTFAQCAEGGCQHAANSCHYGGRDSKCIGQSYAVDFGDEQNTQTLSAAATACGANFIGPEASHLHVSVGKSCGCN
jgi:hypothetical protein